MALNTVQLAFIIDISQYILRQALIETLLVGEPMVWSSDLLLSQRPDGSEVTLLTDLRLREFLRAHEVKTPDGAAAHTVQDVEEEPEDRVLTGLLENEGDTWKELDERCRTIYFSSLP